MDVPSFLFPNITQDTNCAYLTFTGIQLSLLCTFHTHFSCTVETSITKFVVHSLCTSCANELTVDLDPVSHSELR